MPAVPSQALRYEAADDSRLAAFLVARARRSITVASFLFWCVAVNGQCTRGLCKGGCRSSTHATTVAGFGPSIVPCLVCCTTAIVPGRHVLPCRRYLLTELTDDSFCARAQIVQVCCPAGFDVGHSGCSSWMATVKQGRVCMPH